MKKFLDRASKTLALPKPAALNQVSTNPTTPHTTGLHPKYVVPPVPHPAPHTHIALLVTEDALLIRPHILQQISQHPLTHLRIAWKKPVKVEERTGEGDEIGIDWANSVIVYGIVGVLELFSASYLLVVSGKKEVGNLFEPTHAVYSLNGITAIPLVYERAKIVLNTLASQNSITPRPSLLPTSPSDTVSSDFHEPDSSYGIEPPAQYASIPSPRVQFSEEEKVKVLTPVPERSFTLNVNKLSPGRSPSPSPSDISSTPSSSDGSPTSPIAKALASRLSFWSRLSKRNSLFPTSPDQPLTEEAELILPQTQEELDAIIEDAQAEPSTVLDNILAATAPPPPTAEEKHSELEEKVIRECIREYTKGGMYFAYNFDITRSLQHKQQQLRKSRKQNDLLADLLSSLNGSSGSNEHVDALAEPYPTLPLWRRVDRQFWWNEWLAKPFIDAGLHPYVLPIMQGYYQISSFDIPPNVEMQEEEHTTVDYAIVSRRSRDRAGLRYQRRGIDDEAHVANFVETETIMRVTREGVSNVFCYVQIRGSIPLFWTQTGYGLKPPPMLSPERTHAQNLDTMRRHFERSIPLYGPHTIVNLSEQHGKEAAVTQGYREYATELANKDAMYNEYDFHQETKGMKYENISKLIETMERTFEQQGYLWISGSTTMSEQKGVFRVNCIDCLDRTNVVQSAFARYVLNRQLGAVALQNPAIDGRSEMDIVFNDVWANNGDAISRAYAGTSALKGDFTRTGKRDLSGLLNDGVNSLARMYSSTFSDWFCQAVIDFMLGHRTLSVFSEFLLKLQSSDPKDLIRLEKIRQEAIGTSVERVLSEGERLLGGWTVFSPEEIGVKVGEKWEEKVLLLTAKALYIISYDYTLEKVKMYTRVPLGDITSLVKGAYILSPLEEASRDPLQNAGLVVTWQNNNGRVTTRVTSYSVRNSLDGISPRAPGSPRMSSRRTATHSKEQHSLNTFSTTHAESQTDLPSDPPIPAINSLKTVGRASSNRLSVTLSRAAKSTLTSFGSMPSTMPSPVEDTTFAAFKMLPIDPTRIRRAASTFIENSDHDIGMGGTGDAKNCKEAAETIVDAIRRACGDVGNRGSGGVTVEYGDVVSLAEAQRMTSMYAKMEYGLKRLLWLGG